MASRDPERPNVIVVLSDDQGPWALGRRNPELQTPTLDKLAEQGVVLENFFCTSPVCSPARASLLTGQMPSRHGVHDWIRQGNTGPAAVDFLAGRQTFVGRLAEEGWRCALVGKWHLGASDQPRDEYVHWFAHEKGGGPYFGATMLRGRRRDDSWDGTDVEVIPGYLTDALTDEALDVLAAEADTHSPFLLNLHYTAPHVPWIDQHPHEYTDRYVDTPFLSCPQDEPHPWRLDFSAEMNAAYEDPRPNLIGYFAAVTAMDAGIGRVLDRLDALDLAESTLVLFLSDNGFSCGQHGLWGKGNATYPPNMFEESVGVPAIAHQPGRTASGHSSSDLLSGYDVFPTLLDWCGVRPSPGWVGPGRSFAGQLRGEVSSGSEDHVVVFDEYGGTRMIRTPQWKYVHRAHDLPDELYDMVNDPGETTNLADHHAHALRQRELRAWLEAWFHRHANEIDGRTLPVTGVGQLAPATEHSPEDAFSPLPPREPKWLAD